MPAALSVAPVAASKPLDLWIIGVVLGACVVMLLFFACLYWRWKAGGPKGKLDLEKIQMTEKGEAASKVCCFLIQAQRISAEISPSNVKAIKH